MNQRESLMNHEEQRREGEAGGNQTSGAQVSPLQTSERSRPLASCTPHPPPHPLPALTSFVALTSPHQRMADTAAAAAKPPAPADAKKDGKKKDAPEELSAEDKELQERLTQLVERSCDADSTIQHNALEMLRSELRSSTR